MSRIFLSLKEYMNSPASNHPESDEPSENSSSGDETSSDDIGSDASTLGDRSESQNSESPNDGADTRLADSHSSSTSLTEKRKAAALSGFDKAPGAHPDFPRPDCQWYHYTNNFRLAMVTVVVLGLLIVSVGGVLAHGEWKKRQAVHAVTDFLQAVHDKDVPAAIEHLSDTALQEVSREPFLTEDALSSHWSIGDINLVQFLPETHRDTAIVEASILSADGVEVSHEFSMNRAGTVWKIENPFTRIDVPTSMLGAIDINGFAASFSSESNPVFSFFPGVYEYFTDSPKFIETEFDAVLKLGSDHSYLSEEADGELEQIHTGQNEFPNHILPYLHPAEEPQEELNDHIAQMLDACIAEIDSDEGWSCWFNRAALPLPDDLNLRHDREEPAEWEIKEYPKATLMMIVDDYPNEMLSLTNLTDGIVDVTAPVIDSETNATHEFTYRCNLNIEGLQPTYEDDGTVTFTYSEVNEPDCHRVSD